MGVVAIGVRFRYPTCMSSGVSHFEQELLQRAKDSDHNTFNVNYTPMTDPQAYT